MTLRPLELLRLLSLGALVEESLSTRLDSVRAPDLLWVSPRREPERVLDEDDRLEDERLFDLDDELFFEPDELFFEPDELFVLRDREDCLGILPTLLLS